MVRVSFATKAGVGALVIGLSACTLTDLEDLGPGAASTAASSGAGAAGGQSAGGGGSTPASSTQSSGTGGATTGFPARNRSMSARISAALW